MDDEKMYVKQECCATDRILAGGLHDLAQADAHSLSLVALLRAQPVLQDGDDLWKNLLSQLPH